MNKHSLLDFRFFFVSSACSTLMYGSRVSEYMCPWKKIARYAMLCWFLSRIKHVCSQSLIHSPRPPLGHACFNVSRDSASHMCFFKFKTPAKPPLRRVFPLGCRPASGTENNQVQGCLVAGVVGEPRSSKKRWFSKRSPTLGRSRAAYRAGARR